MIGFLTNPENHDRPIVSLPETVGSNVRTVCLIYIAMRYTYQVPARRITCIAKPAANRAMEILLFTPSTLGFVPSVIVTRRTINKSQGAIVNTSAQLTPRFRNTNSLDNQ